MAIYTTFFLCQPQELPGGFPGWRLPLEQPRRREVRNPFTGKVLIVETREPQWPEDAHGRPGRDYQVVAIEGRYEEFLQSRLPPFVRACPHWAAKGLTSVQLDPLIRAAGVEGALECAIYSPPSSGAVVQHLPPAFLSKLGSLNQMAVAERWAAVMSTPEHTHSVSGLKLSDGWTATEALEILRSIVALARKAIGGQRMYLLTEA
jgi:hypothetical protein